MHDIFDDFMSGLSWSIGNGKLTSLWDDKWLDNRILRLETTRPVETIHSNWKVSDCFDDATGRKWDILESYFDEEILLRLHVIIGTRALDIGDMPYWSNSTNGSFSCKSAYSMLMSRVSETHSTDIFKSIWKLKIPHRNKHFAWLCLNNRLLTNVERHRRHLTDHVSCPRCQLTSESICHALRGCNVSAGTWKEIIPRHFWMEFFFMSADNWFKVCLKKDDTSFGFNNWKQVFVITTGTLWTWRNKSLFDSNFFLPSSRGRCVRTMIEENDNCWHYNNSKHSKPQRTECWLSWSKLDSPFWKLNTDGACLETNGHIAAGGVLRDNNGDWKGGFLHNIGRGNSFEAELWGILSGLHLAIARGISNLVVESDCAEAVNFINDICPAHHPSRSLIRSIQLLREKFETIRFFHVFRECNRCADVLAKSALASPLGVYVLDQVPLEIKQMIIDDLLGVALPRNVIV
ncbi:Polynucleotidyl transferase ribonuclease H-like superfamily protein [Euphorbia peplus]|nr:Polynucleotidyl transferase ribonuclease H-like superfamily protein [Euphorbia peplus]